MQTFDVAVIGAGAAGLMCAALAGLGGRRVVLIDHAAKEVVRCPADLNHEDYPVAQGRESCRIADGHHRRAVTQDQIEGLGGRLQRVAHPVGAHQLGGIGRERPARQKREIGNPRRLRDRQSANYNFARTRRDHLDRRR